MTDAPTTNDTAKTASEALREVLHQIDTGEVTASAGERIYIAGALAALDLLAENDHA